MAMGFLSSDFEPLLYIVNGNLGSNCTLDKTDII